MHGKKIGEDAKQLLIKFCVISFADKFSQSVSQDKANFTVHTFFLRSFSLFLFFFFFLYFLLCFVSKIISSFTLVFCLQFSFFIFRLNFTQMRASFGRVFACDFDLMFQWIFCRFFYRSMKRARDRKERSSLKIISSLAPIKSHSERTFYTKFMSESKLSKRQEEWTVFFLRNKKKQRKNKIEKFIHCRAIHAASDQLHSTYSTIKLRPMLEAFEHISLSKKMCTAIYRRMMSRVFCLLFGCVHACVCVCGACGTSTR